jgi:FKBP-type peptidyl-prolyl cis-trans isomerase
MHQRQSAPFRSSPIESLESRTLLSVTPTTTTTIKVSTTALELGQSVTVSFSVKGSKHSGKLAGVVELLDNGTPFAAAGNTLAFPLKHGKGSYRFGPGDAAFFTGTNQISAEFVSSNSLPDSTSATDTVTVTEPTLTTTTDGLGIATFGKGKGKAIKAGQEAQVVYTGFLAADGSIFDYATANHGAGAKPYLSFEVEANPEQVIQGFDEGTLGMKVGQTRLLDIPSDLGYGAQGAGSSIPANAELFFLVTLQKISKAPKA